MTKRSQTIQLISGGIILSTGLGIAAIYAWNRNFVGVFTGFSLFIIGYEISQYSVYTSAESKARAFIADMVESSGMIDFFMAVIGLGTLTYGMTLLFRSVQETRLSLAVLATLVLFGGYMLAHFAINKTVI
jgi:hypothetical protein